MTPLPQTGIVDGTTPPKVGPGTQWLEDMRDCLAEVVGMSADGDPLVISTGSIVPSLGSHRVDTEAAAAADDLTNIDPTAVPDGRWLLIRATDPARVVTVRHGAAGIGQILLADGQPYVLSAARQFLALKLTNNIWEEVFRSLAGDLGTAAKKNTGTTTGTVPVLIATGMPAVSGESLTDIPRFGNFSPSQQAAPNMTLKLTAGSVQVGTALIKVAAQSSGTIAAPAAHPRNDIVYIDSSTGVIGVAAGTENVTPADPGIPTGKLPIARLRLTVGQTSIKSTDFDDVRGLPSTSAVQQTPPVRQTVLSGPITTAGLPNFGGSIGSAAVVATGTFVATAANGFDALGSVDRIGSITNPGWTGLSVNGAMYLGLQINADGTCAPVSTSSLTYVWGGTPSISSNAYTYNIQQMKMYCGNGTVANEVNVVFVGEVTVASSAVSAITWYALMGRYQSAAQALPISALLSVNHNLGVRPRSIVFSLANTISNLNYAVGDVVVLVDAAAGGSGVGCTLIVGPLTVAANMGSSLNIMNKTTNLAAAITFADWNGIFTADRGW